MIITALLAKDFRKYEHLQLDNLPERGLVAVTGGNESGKSSIGDAIQFALFGCTEQFGADEATKLIRWGTPQASVTLKLQHRGFEYRLIRSINQSGDVMATLFSTEEGSTLADTPEAVEKQLKSLLGYNHKAFIQAFYWNQQNAQSAQSDTDNLRSVAGLKEYAHLNEQLQSENRERIQTIEGMNTRRKESQAALNAQQIDDARLPELETVGSALEERQQYFLQLAQRVDKEAERYPENHELFLVLKQHVERMGIWTKLSLLVFILALLAGIFLLFAPPASSHWLASLDSGLRDTLGRTAIRVAAITALISAALLLYGWYLDIRRMRPLRQQASNLANTLREGFHITNTPANEQLEGTTAAYYLLQTQTDIPTHSSDHADIAVLPEWAKSAERYEIHPSNVQSAADALNISMENRNREFGKYLRSLHSDIDREHDQLNQRTRMQASLDQQEEALEYIRRDRVIFDTAIDLLQRNAGHSIGRFNQLVRQRCGELLKRFTHGHYESLELMPDFSLKVLSEKKGDYLDFNEISAGTQRQIALAMRVAIANALADNTQTATQLLFLDEPFAFFDPERTTSTLQSLQETSQGAVSQIWVTAQTLPEGAAFARVIHCPQGSPTLAA
jgi:DNA repair exonuclease SbcCD ATPase subunit